MTHARILILYYSRGGTTAALARHAARGVEQAGAEAILRTVPGVRSGATDDAAAAPTSGPPWASNEDLRSCDGLLLGSPTRFGNMAAPLKYFLEQTSDLWLSGALVDKPAGVFTASTSQHGGQESTLLTMALPLVHHGMVWAGVPYTVPELFTTQTGGGPYGASHVAGAAPGQVSDEEALIAAALGHRVAMLAVRLRRD